MHVAREINQPGNMYEEAETLAVNAGLRSSHIRHDLVALNNETKSGS
jgi:hypothetical protein